MTTAGAGRITAEALEKLRALIGRELKINAPPHLTEVTEDAIRHWAYGIGGRNPLWTDSARAANTRFEGRIAPSTMILCFSRLATGYAGGLPGVHGLYAGSDYTFDRQLKTGDRLNAKAILEDVVEKEGRYSGRALDQIARITFRRQDGERLATGTSWVFRMESQAARSAGKHDGMKPATYTNEDLERIWAVVDAEEPRGARSRYWDDVADGDAIPDVVKGPLTVSDNVMFAMAWGGAFVRAHGFARDYYRKHPGVFAKNDQGVPDFNERVHWDRDFAQSVGLKHGYDYGGQRFAWMGHLVTNWMGDQGFLRRLRVEFRRFNLIGDTSWCRGRVVRKYLDGDEPAVDLEISSVDQRDVITTKGLATVYLERRRDADLEG